jgi:molybdopterin-guanine dinucleotide biosynthesis protein A
MITKHLFPFFGLYRVRIRKKIKTYPQQRGYEIKIKKEQVVIYKSVEKNQTKSSIIPISPES